MPSSAKDRFTVDYEYVYFFSKSQKYYFKTQYEPMAREYDSDFDNSLWREGKAKHQAVAPKQKTHFSQPPNTLGRIKRSVWSINPQPFKEAHFAVYPEKLCETPIKAGCPVGGTVLDCFAGAATTGLVALKLARNFIGIELNKEYIKLAEKRLEPYLLQSKIITSFD